MARANSPRTTAQSSAKRNAAGLRVALAALDDVDLFLLERTFGLPIIGTSISTGGFFLFAPLLLLALFLYFQIMVEQLLECYGRLRQIGAKSDGQIDGLPVAERVEPWFLTILLKKDIRPLDRLGRIVGNVLFWAVAPVTIFALGYRYLRAHDFVLTSVHCGVTAIAFTYGALFYLQKSTLLLGSVRNRLLNTAIAMRAVAIIFGMLFLLAWLAIKSELRAPYWLRFLSPHALLFRAELSRQPEDWLGAKWITLLADIEELEACWPACPEGKNDHHSRLTKLRDERDSLVGKVEGVELGHVPAPLQIVSPRENPGDPDRNICDSPSA
jgi:hypothetical protein